MNVGTVEEVDREGLVLDVDRRGVGVQLKRNAGELKRFTS